LQCVEQAGYEPGTQSALRVGSTAPEFYRNGKYRLNDADLALLSCDFTNLVVSWCDTYPVSSI
jgi:enolase